MGYFLNGMFGGKKNYPPLPYLVELLWVVNNDLYSHLHFGLLQAEVQAGNLGINNTLHHACEQTHQLSLEKSTSQ